MHDLNQLHHVFSRTDFHVFTKCSSTSEASRVRVPVTKRSNRGNTLATEQTQHSFQSERVSKAQMTANQRSINYLHSLVRNSLIILYNDYSKKNRNPKISLNPLHRLYTKKSCEFFQSYEKSRAEQRKNAFFFALFFALQSISRHRQHMEQSVPKIFRL